jgi:diguanylate cyclase
MGRVRFWYRHRLWTYFGRDGLTRLPGWGSFRLGTDHPRGRASFLLVVDLDDFAWFNNRHGHVVGDLALIRVARALVRTLPRRSRVYRTGGEKFIAVLVSVDRDRARAAAEKARKAIAAVNAQLPFGVSLVEREGVVEHVRSLTATIALVPVPPDAKWDARRSHEVADEAILHGKVSGKNQVVELSPEKLAAADPA